MPINDLLLMGVILVLIVIAYLLYALLRTQVADPAIEIRLEKDFESKIAGIFENAGQAIKHHTNASAVLALIDQIEEDPEAVERLQKYPETVRAAAWIHYVDCLGKDLQQAQARLSAAHQAQTNYAFNDAHKQNAINTAQNHVKDVRAKLDAAIAASGQKFSPRAV